MSLHSLSSSSLSRLLRVAAHDFDLLCCNGIATVQLEIDILDEESPDIVAEAVGIQVALYRHIGMSAILSFN